MGDKPAEVVNMFSEALKILDENTVHYMIEEMQKQIDEDKETIAEKDSVIAEKDSVIAEKDSVIAEKTVLLDKSKTELANALAEIDRLKKQLQEDS